jgi:mannitol/fructose-specific phosphotransferase system IIA component
VGIAANSDEHMNVLAALADAIEDEEDAKKLWQETSVENIFKLLSQSL